MSKLAVPAVFIFYRDALDTYARLTATPAEAALRVLQILLATLLALPHEASHTEDPRSRACILRPSARLSRRCPRPYCVLDMGFREDLMPETQFPTFSDSRKPGFRDTQFSETLQA